jgi:hypothetical protein
MGIVEYFHNTAHSIKIAVPSAAHCPNRPRLVYIAHGSAIDRDGKFVTDIASDLIVEVPDHCVDILLFWHTSLRRNLYTISILDLGGDQSTRIKLSDNCIQLGDQIVKPIYPFHLSESDVYGFNIIAQRNMCYVKHFVAISLAVNGAHLLY